jgi:hypothetical protein
MHLRRKPLIASLLAVTLAVTLAACSRGRQPGFGGATAPTGPTPPSSPPASSEPTAPTEAPATPAGAPPAASKAPQPTTPGPNATPDGVVFNYRPDSKPKQIFLAGNFNDWKPSNDKFLMKDDDGDGTYSITVKLVPGTYQYKFVIDGQWTKDPYSPSDAPDGFGGRNGKFDVK